MRRRTAEVARLLGKKFWQVHYAHRSGQVPEPTERFNNARVYGPDDVRKLADYFGVDLPPAVANEEKSHSPSAS